MRADRLLSLMLLLQANGSMTAQELARRLEVSERTIYRDVDALSVAGIPVYTESGASGGIFLDKNYRVSLTGLTSDQVQSLFLSSGVGPLRDLGLDKAATDSLLKLFAALPSVHRRQVEQLRQRIYIDPEGWFESGEPTPFLPLLQQAVWDDRVVEFTYDSPGGRLSPRVIEPYALVAKANVWYLVGKKREGAWRTFRVARMTDARLTDAHFDRDLQFDIRSYWSEFAHKFTEKVMEGEEPYTVVVRVHSDQLRFFCTGLIGMYDTLATDNDAWTRLQINYPSMLGAQMNVLAFAPHVEVIEPKEFREWMLEVARTIQGLHR